MYRSTYFPFGRLRNQPFSKNVQKRDARKRQYKKITRRHFPRINTVPIGHFPRQSQLFADRDNVWPFEAQYEGKLANSRCIFSAVSDRLFLCWPRDVISDITCCDRRWIQSVGSKRRWKSSWKIEAAMAELGTKSERQNILIPKCV